MPIIINGATYYRTIEVYRKVGISRSTLLRWFKNSIIKDSSLRDRREWRLFTETDIKRIENEAQKVR
jgi:predicted site-specific integrase-resolvase